MENKKLVSIPLANHFHLSTSQCPKKVEETEDMSKVLYASVVGCLMYAMVSARPNSAYAISVVSEYMENPRRRHWDAVKSIFRYLKGTTKYDITFVRQKRDFLVIRYVDMDYARDLDDRRLTAGYVFTLVVRPICWRSMM